MKNFEKSITNILEEIGEDPNREGLIKTPKRVKKAYEFMCGGYQKDPAKILNDALFDTKSSEMVVVRGVEFYSLCEHHLLPFFGECSVAYIPDKKVVGLSKIPRMIDVFARRLQIQERMTEQIADAIMETVKPKGVAVVSKARHMCMEMRGVEKFNSTTSTSALRGLFMEQKTREEFFSIINAPTNNRF